MHDFTRVDGRADRVGDAAKLCSDPGNFRALQVPIATLSARLARLPLREQRGRSPAPLNALSAPSNWPFYPLEFDQVLMGGAALTQPSEAALPRGRRSSEFRLSHPAPPLHHSQPLQAQNNRDLRSLQSTSTGEECRRSRRRKHAWLD